MTDEQKHTIEHAQGADMTDAYVGAREDLEDWKRRALSAEELNRKFMREINGPTHMGEPVLQGADARPVAIYQVERLAREVEVECLAGSGVNFYMAAEMAIERMIEMLAGPSMQIAEVCQDADGFKHIEPAIEDLDDIPAGTRLYATRDATPVVDARPVAQRDGAFPEWRIPATCDATPSDAAVDALKWIKVLVSGDSAPRWTNAHQTAISRGMIVDIIDKAIAASAPMEKT